MLVAEKENMDRAHRKIAAAPSTGHVSFFSLHLLTRFKLYFVSFGHLKLDLESISAALSYATVSFRL